MTGLREILHDAVPPAPDLIGLSERAERRARTARTRRRVGVGVAAVGVAVAVAAAALFALPDHRQEPAASDHAADTACESEPLGSDTGSATEATYVRFCPVPSHIGGTPALVPDVALTTDVAPTVRHLMRFRPVVCLHNADLVNFEIQIGHAEGGVTAYSHSACDTSGYDLLMTAIARQQADRLPTPATTQPTSCAATTGGVSATSPLLSLPAVRAYECSLDVLRLLTPAQGERLRVAVLSGFTARTPRETCAGIVGPPTYVLELADGSRHTITGGTCGNLVVVDGETLGGAITPISDLISPQR